MHVNNQNLSEITEYECKENWILCYFNISLILVCEYYDWIVAVISDEYKRGPSEGRALYLDAQATTPLVNMMWWITI